MRVFLCQAYLGQDTTGSPLAFPIGLAYLASMIKEEHDVFCWDPNVVEQPDKELPKLLENISPDVVGLSLRNVDSAISCIDRWYYPLFVSMVKIIKKTLPSCKLVVGGAGFSLFAEEIMKRNPEIDFGIVLDGEHAFKKLLQNFDHPERVNNVVFRRNDKLCFTEIQCEDFVSLPFPSREFFDMRAYKKVKYSVNVQIKRGCAFKCIFCPNNFLSGYEYRLRSPRKVVDEIENLVNTYDLNDLFFVDSTFNFPYEHSRKICQELIKRKLRISWTADLHPAFVNEESMREAVKSGGAFFAFSPDGASDRTLDLLGKSMEVNHIEKTISAISKVEGANTAFNFMYDIPFNNKEHVVGLARIVPKMMLKLRKKLLFLGFTKMRIYPHCPLYDLSIREGKISRNTNILYPIYYSSEKWFSPEKLITDMLTRVSHIHAMAVSTFNEQ